MKNKKLQELVRTGKVREDLYDTIHNFEMVILDRKSRLNKIEKQCIAIWLEILSKDFSEE
jgi:transcriptional regulator of acetoin/glycerol metabolism